MNATRHPRRRIARPVNELAVAVMIGSAMMAPVAALAQAAVAPPAMPEPVAAPVPAVASTASAPAAKIENPYTLNAGDEVEIYVWGEERLQRTLRVLPDGTIAFPLVGQLRVEGLSPQQVEKMVSQNLKDQYRGDVPNVTVSVRTPSGMQFSVMGKVRSPGAFTSGRYVNLLDALSMAGGPAEFANLDNVLILRRENGALTPYRAKLSTLFRSGALSGDISRANIIALRPGDVVIVP